MMTDEPAAIQASFADFRLIKGRKQAQIILEIPIEGADAALAALGGIPQPQSDRWVAVARLNGGPYKPTEPVHIRGEEKRKWGGLKLSQQAGIRCSEPGFIIFLQERFSPNGQQPTIATEDRAAEFVRGYCGVDSRSGINDNPDAAERWRQLERSYQAWMKVAE